MTLLYLAARVIVFVIDSTGVSVVCIWVNRSSTGTAAHVGADTSQAATHMVAESAAGDAGNVWMDGDVDLMLSARELVTTPPLGNSKSVGNDEHEQSVLQGGGVPRT